jgi:DNA repair protein RecO (recombination protein O)
MSNIAKDTAVCLRKVDYSETSQVVTFFARDAGKLPTMAKGARRKKSSFGGSIEIFSFGQIVYLEGKSSRLATLTEFDPKPIFIGLSRNLDSLNAALYGAELVDRFTEEHDPHASLFDVFTQFLEDVQHAGAKHEAIAYLIVFQLTLLNEVGTKLVLERCANCKIKFSDSWPAAYFSSTANGLVCPDCESSFVDKLRLDRDCATCMSDLRKLTSATDKTIAQFEKIITYHFTSLMHRPPKMAKYFIGR